MVWKPEYAEARKNRAKKDPEYRAKRNAQSVKDKEKKKEYMKNYYSEHPEKFRPKTAEQREKYKENRRKKYAENADHRMAIREAVKAWQHANPEARKAQRIKKYGITMTEFSAMMTAQGGKCAICGHQGTEDRNFFPVVDHCHRTKKPRGLLCMNCNMGIGKFKDNPLLMRKAALYIESHI